MALLFAAAAAAAAKSLQSCPTLWDPIDGNPPGSPVPGILQARTLEWVAISSSNTWKWKVKVKSLNRVGLLVTPWTAAHQAPPSMGFSRQEYWSGMPLPSPQGGLSFCNSWGSKESDMPERLNWTDIFLYRKCLFPTFLSPQSVSYSWELSSLLLRQILSWQPKTVFWTNWSAGKEIFLC